MAPSSMTFDRHSETYEDQLADAIGGIGDPAFFTEIKARLLVKVAETALGSARKLSALDVGCGPGLTDEFLVDDFGSVVGVDVSQQMVERARKSNPASRYVVYDGRRLPFENGSFDLSFAICVLHHVEPGERLAFAEELVRVTRPGGLIALFEHNPLNPLTRVVVSRCEFDEGVELLPLKETKRLLRTAGAEAAMSRYILFFPWRAELLRRTEDLLRYLPLGAQYMVTATRR
jgi:SAM-dependent methyltransferase